MSLKIKLPVVVKDRVVQTFTTLGDYEKPKAYTH